MIISIPFSGFYETWHMAHMEDEVEQIAEDFGVDEEQLWDRIDHRKWREEVALEYSMYMQDQVGFRWEFHSLWSPNFYNFQNDEIQVKVGDEQLRLIQIKALQHEGFRGHVAKVCASRDGFISYIPDDLRNWPTEWDERHYGIALEFLVLDEDAYMEDRIREDMMGNSGYSLPLEMYEELMKEEEENVQE